MATIDLTSDAITDQSSDGENLEDNISPVRRVQKLLRPSAKPRRKKMPPELKIIPAPVRKDPILS